MSQRDVYEDARQIDPRAWCGEHLPDGKVKGGEWVVRSPLRDDRRPGSFAVDLRTGLWYDHATGDGGDLIGLHAQMYGVDTRTAAQQMVGGELPRRAAVVSMPEEPVDPPVMPVPVSAPPRPREHPQLGTPTHVYRYTDVEGRACCYVCRWDTRDADRSKTFRPLTYFEHAGWQWRAPQDVAPWYGLDRLGAPERIVLICEGEKAADAAHRIAGSTYACVAWMGGSGRRRLVQGDVLAGRHVVIWPDADEPGRTCARELAEMLRQHAASVVVARLPDDVPKGWDLADADPAEWSASRIADHHRPEAVRLAIDEDIPFGSVWPHMSVKNRPLSTIENVQHMLEQYGISCWYDEVRKRVTIDIPDTTHGSDNADNVAIATLQSLCVRNGLPHSQLDSYLTAIADAHRRNPVRDWMRAVTWDGVDRIRAICDTLHVDDELATMRDTIMYRWLLTAAEAVLCDDPEWSGHGVLVLQGAQGAGKTRWVSSLVPKGSGWAASGEKFDASNKDHILSATSRWLFELGELDGVFKKEIEALKAFITAHTDTVRAPYARRASSMRRRTAFIASVNRPDYLIDDTGNRRWWTVPITGVDHSHDIDIQQLWAQVAQLVDEGHHGYMTAAEQLQLAAHNQRFEPSDPYYDRAFAAFDWASSARPLKWTTTQVLDHVQWSHPTSADARKMAAALRSLGARQIKGRPVTFALPPQKN